MQAIELERQQAGYELEVSELHAYTMAIVQEVSWPDCLHRTPHFILQYDVKFFNEPCGY